MYCTKMKFSVKDFFSKCDQIRSLLRIWSNLLKESLMENFIFWAVMVAFLTELLHAETWARRFYVKKLFLKILQNSYESTSARVSF